MFKCFEKILNLFFVVPPGEVSNFFSEDFDAVLDIIQAEKQKKTLKF